MMARRKMNPSAALNWAAIPKRKASDMKIERSRVVVCHPRLAAPDPIRRLAGIFDELDVSLRVASLDALSFPRGVDLPQPLGRLVLEDHVCVPLGPEGREPHQDGDRVVPLLGQRPADEIRPLPSSRPARSCPSLSSSRSLFERTLGVSPGVDLSISLNLSFFIMAMSLRIRIVHLRPRTPRLVAIGQFAMGTAGTSKSARIVGVS